MSIHYDDGYVDACPNCGEEYELYTEGIEHDCADPGTLVIERYCSECGGTFTEVYGFIRTVFDEETV